MIDPNRGVSPEVASQCRQLAYERFRIDLFNTVESHLKRFDMSWKQLEETLDRDYGWYFYFSDIKEKIGVESLTLAELNDIMSVFSTEAHLIFKPRFPWTST